jgi:hypothetical protein
MSDGPAAAKLVNGRQHISQRLTGQKTICLLYHLYGLFPFLSRKGTNKWEQYKTKNNILSKLLNLAVNFSLFIFHFSHIFITFAP